MAENETITPVEELPGFPWRPGQTATVQKAIRLLRGCGFRVSLSPYYYDGATTVTLMLSQREDDRPPDPPGER